VQTQHILFSFIWEGTSRNYELKLKQRTQKTNNTTGKLGPGHSSGPEVPNHPGRLNLPKYKGGGKFLALTCLEKNEIQRRNKFTTTTCFHYYLAGPVGGKRPNCCQIEGIFHKQRRDGSKSIVRKTERLSLEELRDLEMIRETPDAKAAQL